MTGVDTNTLIDLMVSSTVFHKTSKEKMASLSGGVCTTPTNVGECLRLLTHPRVFKIHLAAHQAVETLEQFLDYYSMRILEEPTDWWIHLKELVNDVPGIRGNEIFDARIALCLKLNGVKKIMTRDANFRKYPFLTSVI